MIAVRERERIAPGAFPEGLHGVPGTEVVDTGNAWRVHPGESAVQVRREAAPR